jgi:ParB family chromosome partitioning protein
MPNIGQLRNVNSVVGTTDKNSVRLTIKDIPLGDIIIRENVRKDYTGIEELAESIRQHGLLQPITVYIDGEQYVVKTGHRRFMASQMLYKQVPDRFHSIRCIVSGAENLAIIQLVENVQREDLSQIDLFNGLSSLREQGMTLKEIAQTMGKSESYIKFLFVGVNDLKKTPELKEAMNSLAGQTNAITLADVVLTKGIPDEKERLEILEQHGKGEITRAEMRAKVREAKKPDIPTEVKGETDFPESSINAKPNVKYSVSSDGLTVSLTFSNAELFDKVIPKIKRLFEQNSIPIIE